MTPTSSPPVILKDPEGVLPNLSSDDWPDPKPAEPCTPSWATGACGCETFFYESGCHRASCEKCAPGLRTRRMLEIRSRFEGEAGRHDKPVLYTVLTVVPERRAAAADPATWTKWRRAIWKFMREELGGLFAVERTDPCGDKSPDKWHPHLNFLWVQVCGAKPFIDVHALKEEWARITGAERLPSVHHAYSEHPRRLQHWYWYMGRTWPAWHKSVRGHLSVRWLGKYPKKNPRPKCCDKCGQTFLFVTGLDRKGAEELAALGPAAVRWEAEKREMERCLRVCEGPRGRKGGQE